MRCCACIQGLSSCRVDPGGLGMTIPVSIRARSLHCVCAEGGGGEAIVVNRQTPGAWETLIVESWGDRFSFRCANGMLIAAPDGGRAGSLISKHPWDTPG